MFCYPNIQPTHIIQAAQFCTDCNKWYPLTDGIVRQLEAAWKSNDYVPIQSFRCPHCNGYQIASFPGKYDPPVTEMPKSVRGFACQIVIVDQVRSASSAEVMLKSYVRKEADGYRVGANVVQPSRLETRFSYKLGRGDKALAERTAKAIDAGVLFRNPRVEKTESGKQYVAFTPVSMAKYLDEDLRAMGF